MYPQTNPVVPLHTSSVMSLQPLVSNLNSAFHEQAAGVGKCTASTLRKESGRVMPYISELHTKETASFAIGPNFCD